MFEIKNNNDILFCICAGFWLLANIVSALLWKDTVCSNLLCMILMWIVVLIKTHNKKVREWCKRSCKSQI